MSKLWSSISAFSIGAGGLLAGVMSAPEATALAAGTTSLGALFLPEALKAIGSGFLGAAITDAQNNVAAILKGSQGKDRLPVNHDFARAVRMAQLDGLEFILNQFKARLRSDPTSYPHHSEQFLKAAFGWTKSERAHALSSQFLSEAPTPEDLSVAILPQTAERDAAENDPLAKWFHQAELSFLAELSDGLAQSIPPEFTDLFLMQENVVCWISASQAFFVEAVKTDPRLRTVMLFDQISGVQQSIDAASRQVMELAGQLGDRLSRIDAALDQITKGHSDRIELQAWLKAAALTQPTDAEASIERALAARFPRDTFVGWGPSQAVSERIAELTRHFVGRRTDLDQLTDRLAANVHSITLVTAPAGVGKSAIMAAMTLRAGQIGFAVVRHFCSTKYLATVPEDNVLGHLVAQICAIDGSAQRPELTARAMTDWLCQRLANWPQDCPPLCLIIDSLDECSSDNLATILPRQLAPNVHVLLSCRAEQGEVPLPMHRWLSNAGAADLLRKELSPMAPADVRLWLEEYFGGLSPQETEALASRLMQASGGVALFLQLFIRELHHQASSGQSIPTLIASIPELAEPFRGYVEAELQILDQDVRWSTSARFFLALLTRTKVPLSERDAFRLLKMAYKDGEISELINLSSLDHRLTRWLSIRKAGGQSSFQFCHPRLADIFADLLEIYTEGADRCLLSLAQQWRETPSVYAYEAGLEHLLEAAKSGGHTSGWQVDADALFDTGYLSKRTAAGRISSLVGAYELAASIWPDAEIIQRWSSAVSRNYDLLSSAAADKDPEAIWRDQAAQLSGSGREGNFARYRQPVEGVLEGHQDWVAGASYIPSLGKILSWSFDGTLRLWNKKGSSSGRVMQAHGSRVAGAIWIEEAGCIASWSDYEDVVRLWDDEGSPIGFVDGGPGSVSGVVWIQSIQRLAVWGGSTVKLFDLHSRTLSHELVGHTYSVKNLLWLEDCQSALTWGGDNELRLWPANSLGSASHVLAGHRSEVIGALAIPSLRRIVSWSHDQTLHIWDLDNPHICKVLEGHAKPVKGALWIESQGRIVSWCTDQKFCAWDIEGNLIDSARLPAEAGTIETVVWIEAYQRLLIVSRDHVLRFWGLADGAFSDLLTGSDKAISGALWIEPLQAVLIWDQRGSIDILRLDGRTFSVDPFLASHKDGISGAAWIHELGQILTWSSDRTLRLWKLGGPNHFGMLDQHSNDIVGISWSPKAQRVLTWSTDGTLRIWGAQAEPGNNQLLSGHKSRVTGATWLEDCQKILSWGWDGTVRLWDWDGRPACEPMVGHQHDSHAVWIAEKHRILSWGWDRTLRIWDEAGTPVCEPMYGHRNKIEGALWSSALQMIVSWSADQSLRYWSIDGELIWAVENAHSSQIAHAMEVSDLQCIVSWGSGGVYGSDNTIRFWGANGTRIGETGPQHWNHPRGMVWIEVLKRFLSWGWQSRLLIWSIERDTPVTELTGHSDIVVGALWLDGPRLILSWSTDRTLRLWDEFGNPVGSPMEGHLRDIQGALWIDHREEIMSWSDDGTIRIWSRDGKAISTMSPFAGPIASVSHISAGRFAVAAGDLTTILTL